VWVSHMVGAVLDGLLRWARRTRCARLEPPFESIGGHLAFFVDDLITQFKAFPADGLRKIDEALRSATVDTPQVIELTMVFRLSNLEAFQRELDSVRRRYGA